MSDLEQLRKSAKRVYLAKDFPSALTLYERLIAEGPAEPTEASINDRVGYATTLIALSRLDEAAVHLQQTVALKPDDARLHFKLGEILSRLGRRAEAAEQLAQAAQLQPDSADYQWRLAVELRSLNRMAEAREALDRCLAIDPNHVEGQLLQMEELLTQAPEQDGQVEAASIQPESGGFWVGATRPAANRRPAVAQSLPLIVLEAAGLFLMAIWLRSLF